MITIDGIDWRRFCDLDAKVTAHQLRIWREANKVRFIKLGNQLYLYSNEDVNNLKNNLRKYTKSQKED
jgi:predicted Zn-dependent protease